MSPSPDQALTRAVEDTFEGMAFAQVLDREPIQAPPDEGGPFHAAHIDLSDTSGLRILMMMTMDHLVDTFQTINPGLDVDNLPEPVLIDFVKELTNTAAGHLMSLIEPDRKTMTIGLPSLSGRAEIAAALTAGAGVHAFRYRIEGHDLYASVAPKPA